MNEVSGFQPDAFFSRPQRIGHEKRELLTITVD